MVTGDSKASWEQRTAATGSHYPAQACGSHKIEAGNDRNGKVCHRHTVAKNSKAHAKLDRCDPI
jgi:hypothetical protein